MIWSDNGLVDLTHVLTHALDLPSLVDSTLISLSDLANNTLIDVANLALEQLDIRKFIDSGLATLGELASTPLLNIAQLAQNPLRRTDLPATIEALINPSNFINTAIYDLNDLISNSPIQLRHLVYFGLIDHDDLPPLGSVAAADLATAKIIDSSLLERHGVDQLVDKGLLSFSELVPLGVIEPANVMDLDPVKLSRFGFSAEVVEQIRSAGLIIAGEQIGIAPLIEHTSATLRNLLDLGFIDGDDLQDLGEVLLDDLFMQGTVDRSDLLASDLVETHLLASWISQNTMGQDLVLISDLIDNGLTSLAALAAAGLIDSSDFELNNVSVTENDLIASGLVPQYKLDEANLIQTGPPDFVNVDSLFEHGLATVQQVVAAGFIGQAELAISEILLTELLTSNIVGKQALNDAGLGSTDQLSLEALLDSVLVSEDELIDADLIDPLTFYQDSMVRLQDLVEDGLVGVSDIVDGTYVNLDRLLANNLVDRKYIDDNDMVVQITEVDLAGNSTDDIEFISIDTLLNDSNTTLLSLVAEGVLGHDDFVDKIYEQSVLEADSMFADGQFDDIVRVGTVELDHLLDSIFFAHTLDQYVASEFLDRFDFENKTLDVTSIETIFSTVDVDDGLGATVTLYQLLAAEIAEITLPTLIQKRLCRPPRPGTTQSL